mgnify:FL=1
MSNRAKERIPHLVISIALMQILQPLVIDPYLPATAVLSKDFSTTNTQIQLVLAVVTFGFFVGQMITSPISDSIGRRRPLFVSLGLYVLTCLAVAMAPTLEFFFVARTLQGLTAASMSVISVAMLRDLNSGVALIKASSKIMAIGSIIWFIGPIFGTVMLTYFNWRIMSLVIAAVAVIVFLVVWKFMPETKPIQNRNDFIFKGMKPRFIHVLKDRSFVGFLVIQMAINVMLFGYLGVIPMLFDSAYGLGQNVGYFISINSFGAYLGIQLGSFLSTRFSAQKMLYIFFGVAVIDGFYLMQISGEQPSVWFVEAGFFVLTLMFGATYTPIQALSLQSHGEEAGTAAALLGSIGSLASAIAGPYLTSLDRTTSFGIGLNAFGTMSIAIVIYHFVVRPKNLTLTK